MVDKKSTPLEIPSARVHVVGTLYYIEGFGSIAILNAMPSQDNHYWLFLYGALQAEREYGSPSRIRCLFAPIMTF